MSTFFTPDTHPDMSLHYHRNIVSPITNADCDPRTIFFRKLHNVTLLLWTHPAANYAHSEQAQLEEGIGSVFLFHDVHQCWSIDHDT